MVRSYFWYLGVLAIFVTITGFVLALALQKIGPREQAAIQKYCYNSAQSALSESELMSCKMTVKKDIEKDSFDIARNNFVASETILFGTITIYLFVIFSLWDGYQKSFNQSRALLTNQTQISEADRANGLVKRFREIVEFVFALYTLFVIGISVVVFVIWPLFPFLLDGAFEDVASGNLSISLIVKYLTGISTEMALFFLILYIRLVHPTLRLVNQT